MGVIEQRKALDKLSEAMGRLRTGGRLPSPPAELPPPEAASPSLTQPEQAPPGPTPTLFP